jgi:hypothetical protein
MQLESAQQEFNDLELPYRIPHMQHLCLHPVFSGSNSSIKSNCDVDSFSPVCCEVVAPVLGEGISDEALNFIRRWDLKRENVDDDREVGPRFVVMESLEAVDYSKPPRRFWRTSWKCMTKRLTDLSEMKIENGNHCK